MLAKMSLDGAWELKPVSVGERDRQREEAEPRWEETDPQPEETDPPEEEAGRQREETNQQRAETESPGAESGGWLTQELPAHWQQLPELQTHTGKTVYRKKFPLRATPDHIYRLRLNGIFYFSTVYLNGQCLGSNEGYFFPQEYEITRLLAPGPEGRHENLLVVEVDCPEEKEKNNKRLITGVFSHWDAMDPATNPGGIWLPVEILETGGAYVREKYFWTESFSGSAARVNSRLIICSDAQRDARIQVTFTPANFEGQATTSARTVRLKAGDNELADRWEVEDCRLWWTHDHGFPHLYNVEIRLEGITTTTAAHSGAGPGEADSSGVAPAGTASAGASGAPDAPALLDREEFPFGIRTVEMKDWICYLNGKRIFLKGNNYPPGDTRIATMNIGRYRADLALARDAHMNILRAHAHVEHPAFYQAADEAGILVWQDFPLQWQYHKEVLPEALRQVQLMARLLFNHPSVAVWCMHNEPIYIVDTKDETFWRQVRTNTNMFLYSWNRDVMDKELQQAVKMLDPTRPAVQSSGELNLIRRGSDTHFYFGWYQSYGPKRKFETLYRFFPKNLRFVTEFGAQSFPNYESSRRFMDPDIRKIDWGRLMERHSFQPEIMRYWIDVDSFQDLRDLIDATQDYQIMINQYYIDRLRLHKYRPTGGILPFMFHDPNPAVQWSILDYWRVPKRSYYEMQKAFNPEYVFTVFARDNYPAGGAVSLPIYVVNDSGREYRRVTVEVRVTDMYGGEILKSQLSASLEADCPAKEIWRLEVRPERPGTYRLHLTLTYGDSRLENSYPLVVVPAG
ncbi:MAG: glycoside hydrolase [Firmicutes bacterium]|nr:glycoside hydrolase [Bacillota bacterium]